MNYDIGRLLATLARYLYLTVLRNLRQSQHYQVPDGDWLCPDCEPVVEKNEEESSDSGECSEEEQVC